MSWNHGFICGLWPFIIGVLLVTWGFIFLLNSLGEMTNVIPFSGRDCSVLIFAYSFQGGCYGMGRVTLGSFWGYMLGCFELVQYIFRSMVIIAHLGNIVNSDHDLRYLRPLWWFLLYVVTVGVSMMNDKQDWNRIYVPAIVTLLIIIYCAAGAQHMSYNTYWQGNNDTSPIYSFFSALPSAGWLFLGIDFLPRLCSVTGQATKRIPIAMLISHGVSIFTAIVLVFAVGLQAPGVDDLGDLQLLPLTPGYATAFHISHKIANILSLPALFGVLQCTTFSYHRQAAAMAKSGLLPKLLGLTYRGIELSTVFCSVAGYVMMLVIHYSVSRQEEALKLFNNLSLLTTYLVYLGILASFLIFRLKFESLLANSTFHNVFGSIGAVLGITIFLLLVICVCGFQADHQVPVIIISCYFGLMTSYYHAVANSTQFFSPEEQAVLIVAYIINANTKTTKKRSQSVQYRQSMSQRSLIQRTASNANLLLNQSSFRGLVSPQSSTTASTTRTHGLERQFARQPPPTIRRGSKDSNSTYSAANDDTATLLGKNSSAKDDSTHVPYGTSSGIAATVKESESFENILLSNKQRKSVQLATVLEKGSNQNSKENSVRSEHREPLSKALSKAEKIEENITESQVSAKVAAALASLVANPDTAAVTAGHPLQQQQLILTSPPVSGSRKVLLSPIRKVSVSTKLSSVGDEERGLLFDQLGMVSAPSTDPQDQQDAAAAAHAPVSEAVKEVLGPPAPSHAFMVHRALMEGLSSKSGSIRVRNNDVIAIGGGAAGRAGYAAASSKSRSEEQRYIDVDPGVTVPHEGAVGYTPGLQEVSEEKSVTPKSLLPPVQDQSTREAQSRHGLISNSLNGQPSPGLSQKPTQKRGRYRSLRNSITGIFFPGSSSKANTSGPSSKNSRPPDNNRPESPANQAVDIEAGAGAGAGAADAGVGAGAEAGKQGSTGHLMRNQSKFSNHSNQSHSHLRTDNSIGDMIRRFSFHESFNMRSSFAAAGMNIGYFTPLELSRKVVPTTALLSQWEEQTESIIKDLLHSENIHEEAMKQILEDEENESDEVIEFISRKLVGRTTRQSCFVSEQEISAARTERRVSKQSTDIPAVKGSPEAPAAAPVVDEDRDFYQNALDTAVEDL